MLEAPYWFVVGGAVVPGHWGMEYSLLLMAALAAVLWGRRAPARGLDLIRVAAAASWGLDVAAEFMGSQTGLGYLIIMQQTYLRTSGIVLLVLVYSTLAVILDTIIAALERRITRWTERRTSIGVVASIVGSA